MLIGYAVQIYFDFSGFTDMAIGLGRMMGFRFVENFDYPYISKSIGEFWRRWHISLSSWFRDYVFLPLEFVRRKSKFFRQQTNILVVFLLTGLWHGFTLNYLLWGALHGLALASETTALNRWLKKAWIPRPAHLRDRRHSCRLGVLPLCHPGLCFPVLRPVGGLRRRADSRCFCAHQTLADHRSLGLDGAWIGAVFFAPGDSGRKIRLATVVREASCTSDCRTDRRGPSSFPGFDFRDRGDHQPQQSDHQHLRAFLNMDMNTLMAGQKGDGLSERLTYLVGAISFCMGAPISLALPILIGRVRAAPVPVLIFLLLMSALALAFALYHLLSIFIITLKKKRASAVAGMAASYGLVLLLLYGIRLPSPLSFSPSFDMGGIKGSLVRCADGMIAFAAAPLLIFSFWRLSAFIILKVRTSFASNDTVCFDRFFLFLFIVIPVFIISNSPAFIRFDNRDADKDYYGRPWFLNAYEGLRYRLGDVIYRLSVLSNDNWLVYTGESSLDDYQKTKLFSEAELQSIQRRLDRLDALLKSKGIKLLVTIPPNKNTIYPEKVPARIPVIGSQSRLDQLTKYLQLHGGLKILDLRPALLKARHDYQVYKATDTHWSSIGAFIAYQEMLNELRNRFPVLVPHELKDYKFVDIPGARGDISAIEHLPVTENHVELVPLFERKVTSKKWKDADKNPAFFMPDATQILITTCDAELPRLVMFRDSFADALIPFLSDHFSRAVYLFSVPTLESFYDAEKPDIVVIEYTERSLELLFHLPEK